MATAFTFPDETEGVGDAENKVDVKVEAEDLVIDVVDDTPERDKGRKALDKLVEEPTDDELAAYSDKVQARIKELTHARHDERREKEKVLRERVELERVTTQLLAERNQWRDQAGASSKVVVAQSLSGANTRVEEAKRAMKDAAEAFDVDAQIEAQTKLSEALADVREMKNIQARALQPAKSTVQTAPVTPQRVAQDPKTLSWQAKNQWFDQPGYEEVTSFALGLSNKLITQGVDPSSDDYYARLDVRMHAKFPELYSDAAESSPTRSKSAGVVAPAGRSSAPKKVTLTATQVATAGRLGLTLQQYAQQVALLENANG